MSSTNKVRFYHLSVNHSQKKLAHVAYFNYEQDLHQAMQSIFQHSIFDLPAPKLIILLEGGLHSCRQKSNNFNENQFSNSVSRLLLDIGRNKLSDEQGAPWVFTNLRDDSIASHIIKTTRHQYLANDISSSRFITIGIDVCPSSTAIDTLNDYQSLIQIISDPLNYNDAKSSLNTCSLNYYRSFMKRLSHNIIYGQKENDSIDRHSVLQSCIQEVGRLRDSDKSECVSIPKIILLVGGDITIAEPIHRFLSTPVDRRKFGLVIIRGTGGLADVLAWACDKIRTGGQFLSDSNPHVLTNVFLRQLRVLVAESLACSLTDELITLVTYLATVQCRKVRVCDEDDDLSFYLLKTLVTENQNQRLPSIRLHLSLAFDLNQPKFAGQMLRANRDIPEEDLIQLAKMAIVRNQVEFLQVLEDNCGFTSNSFGENVELELSTIMEYNHQLFLEFIEHDFGCQIEDVCRSTEISDEHSDDEANSNNVKLFLWALFFDHYSLSLHFWRRLQDRLCGALVAARTFRHIADLCTKRSSTEVVTIEKLRKQADNYENLALRLIKGLYTSNTTMARFALKRENFEFNKLSTLDIAIMSQSENFVGHTSVQQVFDGLWEAESISTTVRTKQYERLLSSAAFSFAQQTDQRENNDSIYDYVMKIPRKLCIPRIKYRLHLLCYLIFLGMFSYYTVFLQTPLSKANSTVCSDTLTPCHKVLNEKSTKAGYILRQLINIWVFAFSLEEFRQAKLVKRRENTIVQAFFIYLTRSSNKLDCLCIFGYLFALILEFWNTPTSLNAAKACIVVDVVLWFIRLLVFFMVHRTVGPMLLMIRQMLHDMLTFFSIFFVFTSAYGVASFTLFKCEQPMLDLKIFRKLFHGAYWHVFGQINELENIEDDFQPTGWTAFLILAFYMAISNILLLNVLVAMLSNTFDRMYSKMDTLWKFHRYHTIKEYIILASLPPPFNLFTLGNYMPISINGHLSHLTSLSTNEILNLRRREVLAYECDLVEQANKEKRSDINRHAKIDLELKKLRKGVSNINVLCESSNISD